MEEETPKATTDDFNFTSLVLEVVQSPTNLILITLIAYLVYKILRDPKPVPAKPSEPQLPRLRKDFTVEELKKFDGTQPDGRVLVAVNGNVFDVTRGRRFYGPGGPYSAYAGRDASRGLATFSVSASSDNTYDDLTDLNTEQMESVREWEAQFKEKYDLVGLLLKPGQEPTNYSDEEEESTSGGGEKEKKDD